MADNGKQQPQQTQSKWSGVIFHLNAAEQHMGKAMDLVSMINFDLQKGADFIGKYRDSLVRTIEESGGTVDAGSVEEQIRDFVPKALQREPQQ